MSHPPTVLVTGSRTRIGRAIAETLAGAGWDVVIHSRSDEAGARAASLDINGKALPVWVADLVEPETARRDLERNILAWRPDCALVLNASVFDNDVAPGRIDASQLRRMLAIHHETSIALVQAAADAPGRTSPGQAVLLLDQNVVNLHADFLAYTLSKSALFDALPRLALALAPFRLNAVAPGPTLPLPEADREAFARACRETPLEHGVEPAEVAQAVLFLLGARSVTGQTLFVDAGQRLCQWREPAAPEGTRPPASPP